MCRDEAEDAMQPLLQPKASLVLSTFLTAILVLASNLLPKASTGLSTSSPSDFCLSVVSSVGGPVVQALTPSRSALVNLDSRCSADFTSLTAAVVVNPI